VGKTDLILKLEDPGLEIISADAMQVYRGLDIGTAKPDREVLRKLPHHLLSIVDPREQFTVGEFVRRVERLVPQIYARGKTPILAGGTAYYLKTFICGLPGSPAGDPQVREELKRLLAERGLAFLAAELRRVDPLSAASINEHDSYRVLRALEIFRASGRPRTAFELPRRARKQFDFLLIGLQRDREELNERIERRVEAMFARGLVEEVRCLLGRGYTAEDPGMKGIGYREFFEMRKGCLLLGGVEELIKRNTRRYAKRQITFFNSLEGARWFQAEDIGAIRRCLEDFRSGHSRLPP